MPVTTFRIGGQLKHARERIAHNVWRVRNLFGEGIKAVYAITSRLIFPNPPQQFEGGFVEFCSTIRIVRQPEPIWIRGSPQRIRQSVGGFGVHESTRYRYVLHK